MDENEWRRAFLDLEEAQTKHVALIGAKVVELAGRVGALEARVRAEPATPTVDRLKDIEARLDALERTEPLEVCAIHGYVECTLCPRPATPMVGLLAHPTTDAGNALVNELLRTVAVVRAAAVVSLEATPEEIDLTNLDAALDALTAALSGMRR